MSHILNGPIGSGIKPYHPAETPELPAHGVIGSRRHNVPPWGKGQVDFVRTMCKIIVTPRGETTESSTREHQMERNWGAVAKRRRYATRETRGTGSRMGDWLAAAAAWPRRDDTGRGSSSTIWRGGTSIVVI
jgi:hypothetical protein